MKKWSFTALLLMVTAWTANAQNADRLIDLRGTWRFSIGDDPAWARADYDDHAWSELFVPSSWEDEGYPGYDGYAWYRKRFRLAPTFKQRAVTLHLGRIDDVDEVYVNGHFVGATGKGKPDFETSYHVFREYYVPAEYLLYGGENVIAVRVLDFELEGGMVEGKVGLYADEGGPPLIADLAGQWQFRTGDDPGWKEEKDHAESQPWVSITVPGRWEVQGFDGYDGFAWYRKTFYLPERYRTVDLVLVLGLIDDLDETYVNGRRVGSTGRMTDRGGHIEGDEWRKLRAYPLPREVLRAGYNNVVEVRVFDGLIDGGIYAGPVGIMTRTAYEQWHDPGKEPFRHLMDKIFKPE